jgi:hypothetical protein
MLHSRGHYNVWKSCGHRAREECAAGWYYYILETLPQALELDLAKLYVPKLFVRVFVALTGILVGIFLMVGDEIIGLIAPSRQLTMHWPLGLVFTIWQSWEIVFVVILVCTIIYIVLIEYLLKDVGAS